MRRVVTPDGVEIACHVEPAAPGAPTLVYAHATGFCGAVWEPVLAGFRDRTPGAGHVVVDQRAHGASSASPHPFDWWDIGRDVLAVLAAHQVHTGVFAVGHSGGAAGLLLAELLAPGTFDGIVAVEPIVPPPPFERSEHAPIAVNAARRRRWFPSRDDARTRWAGRSAFADWVDAALDAYLAHGLVPGTDYESGREGVVLACDPRDEAEWFRCAYAHGAWDRLGEIGCPVTVVAGTRSITHVDGPPAAITDRLGKGRLEMIEGATHFIPMEQPKTVVEAVFDLLRGISR